MNLKQNSPDRASTSSGLRSADGGEERKGKEEEKDEEKYGIKSGIA